MSATADQQHRKQEREFQSLNDDLSRIVHRLFMDFDGDTEAFLKSVTEKKKTSVIDRGIPANRLIAQRLLESA